MSHTARCEVFISKNVVQWTSCKIYVSVSLLSPDVHSDLVERWSLCMCDLVDRWILCICELSLFCCVLLWRRDQCKKKRLIIWWDFKCWSYFSGWWYMSKTKASHTLHWKLTKIFKITFFNIYLLEPGQVINKNTYLCTNSLTNALTRSLSL